MSAVLRASVLRSVFACLRFAPIIALLLGPVLLFCPARSTASRTPVHTAYRPYRQTGPQTLLNESGHLQRPIASPQITAWKRALHTGQLSAEQAAWRQLWLGEWELAADEQPDRAIARFAQVAHRASRASRLRGLAAYDTAISLYFEGAYAPSSAAFRRLLQPKTALHGYDRKACALWLRHASACTGYHTERAKLGIPEPPRLDPLCGAAALASCLREQGLPYSKSCLLSVCRVTGLGSNLQDVLKAATRLGTHAYPVTADEAGLQLLPKPCIAFVEHDHFISVIHADRDGVSYLCSDCGPWPGGRVDLSWKQWHRLEATVFVAVARRGSNWDRLLSGLTASRRGPPTGIQVAALRSSFTFAHAALRQGRLRSLLRRHVTLFLPPYAPVTCGGKMEGLHCNMAIQCPMDHPGGCGPSSGDPVNLATGEEEYTPSADLTVYNPIGPPVVWRRLYNSLRGPNSNYQCYDHGIGWSQGYNVGIWVPGQGGTGSPPGSGPVYPPRPPIPVNGPPLRHPPIVVQPDALPNTPSSPYLMLANGAIIPITPTGQISANNPWVPCTVPKGIPLYIQWNYSSTLPSGYYTIAFPDGSVWVTTLAVDVNGDAFCPLAYLLDKANNFIIFNYTDNGLFPLINTISDSNGVALITVNRNTSQGGAVTSITDRYNRQVNYSVGTFKTTNVPANLPQSYLELTVVSQIVTQGTTPGATHYAYGYTNVSNLDPNNETVPFLSTISTPSPKDGTTMVSAIISYDPTTDAVASVIDANSNQHDYSTPTGNANQTKVTVPGTISYTVTFDNNMNLTAMTDGTNTTQTVQAQYNDPNDPYRPSKVTDGNGIANNSQTGVWEMSWDAFGNPQTLTTPRNIITVYTWGYSTYATGLLLTAQEGAKSPVSIGYTGLGQVQSVSIPLPGTVGSGQTVNYQLAYTSLGNLASFKTPGNNATIVNGVDHGITITYNYTQDPEYNYIQNEALGQPITITRPIDATNLNDPADITHLRYDSEGNLSQATVPYLYNGTYAESLYASFSYNIANQLLQAFLPAPSGDYLYYNYAYPAGPCENVELFNSNTGNTLYRQIIYGYGNEGELLQVSGTLQTVKWAYDAAYRVKQTTDGNLNVSKFTYNMAGYLSKISYPKANGTFDTIQFLTYDNDGNPLTRINGRNITTTYVYNDPESLLTSISYPNSYSVDNTSLSYDGYGRVHQISDRIGTRTYSYDDDDETTEADTLFPGFASALSLDYAYFPDSQLQTMTTPAGSFGYLYDTAGRLSQQTNPKNEQYYYSWTDTDWLLSQSVYSQPSVNNLLSGFGYDFDGTLNGTSDVVAAGSGTGFGLTRDDTGNRTNLNASYPNNATSFGGNTSYAYDTSNRLKSETSTRNGSYSNTFTYDKAGNPTLFRGVDPTSGAGYNADNQNQNSSFVYDGEGNPTTYKGQSLTFDAEDRLSAVGTVSNGWYAEGLRGSKQGSSGLTYFLNDGDLPVCEVSSTGAIQATNTWGPAGLASRNVSGTSTFYAFDPYGNVAQTVNSAGSVTNNFSFDAYGLRSSQASSSDPYTGFEGAAGGYTDWESGLTLFGHRYYDAGAGRFVNRDPIGYAGGSNLYQFVGGAPTMGSDPSGLYFADPFDDNTPDSAFESDFNAGDHPGIDGVKGFASAAVGLIPGSGLIPAIRGCDMWGNPLSPLQRGISGVSGALGLVGPLMEGVGFAGDVAGDLADAGDVAEATETTNVAGGPYSHLPDPPGVGPGKDFTQAQKDAIYGENMNRNGGVLRDDITGEELVRPGRSMGGIPQPSNMAQIDHIIPKIPSDPNIPPGTNSYGNAQVISRILNRRKSNH